MKRSVLGLFILSPCPLFQIYAFSWDSKGPGCSLLLAQLLKDELGTYSTAVESFVRDYSNGGSVPRTDKGFPLRQQWGANR